MKVFLSAILSSILLIGCFNIRFLSKPDGNPCSVAWTGYISEVLYEQVRSDLAIAKFHECKVVRVDFNSAGGSAFSTLAIVQELTEAKKWAIIEFHGRGVIASGASFVIAAGSKGHRYIAKNTPVLIHGMQYRQSGCIEIPEERNTEYEKWVTALYKSMAMSYADSTGRSVEETLSWLICGKEQAGQGDLLIKLGLADKLEA